MNNSGSFIEIPPLNNDMSHHRKVLTDILMDSRMDDLKKIRLQHPYGEQRHIKGLCRI